MSKQTGVGGCGGGCDGVLVRPRRVVERLSPTPAQAANIARNNGTYGDWVTDVPVQGPTDPGIRAAGCWWKKNVVDVATDRQGAMVPQWTQNSLCIGGRGMNSGIGGLGETVRFAGRRVGALGADPPAVAAPATAANSQSQGAATLPSAALSAAKPARTQSAGPPAPPGIWSRLSDAESHWIAATLIQLNDLIVKAGNKPCATWPADLLKDDASAVAKMPAAVACFQGWYNTNLPQNAALRTDGTLDDKTACALVVVTGQHGSDFPTPYPGVLQCGGLSLLAKVGIGAGALAVVGGTVAAVVAASKKKKSASSPG